VEDHHVDRPGVKAQQCVQLTGTNSSIDLIILITRAHRRWSRDLSVLTAEGLRTGRRTTGDGQFGLADLKGPEARRPGSQSRKDTEHGNRGDGRPYSLLTIRYSLLQLLKPLNMRFVDLVVIAEWLHPIPFRTRP
jgi:hypothetical protein